MFYHTKYVYWYNIHTYTKAALVLYQELYYINIHSESWRGKLNVKMTHLSDILKLTYTSDTIYSTELQYIYGWYFSDNDT